MAVAGLANILVYGVIANRLRTFVRDTLQPALNKSRWFRINVWYIFTCHQCCGFWCGLFCGVCILTRSPVGVLMSGFAGSYVAEVSSRLLDYVQAMTLDLINPQYDKYEDEDDDIKPQYDKYEDEDDE